MNEYIIPILSVLLFACVLTVIIYIGTTSPSSDNVNYKNQLAIIGGVTAAAVIIFTILAYIYFNTNMQYLTPFLLISYSFNMFLSIFAVSVATLKLV